MTTMTRAAQTFALALIAACADASPTAPARPTPLPPLPSATWHVHVAEGQALPALVAHRLENGSLVQEFLDSARVEVGASGTWVRHLFISRFRASTFEAQTAEQEFGTWMVTDSGYRFTAEPSGRAFMVARAVPGDSVTLPLRGASHGGFIQATLRTTRPAPSIVGAYRVTAVRGQPVPATIYSWPEFVDGDRLVSIHLVVDSASLRLLANGTYQQAIHYREWEGPVGGGPTTVRHRFSVYDHGAFVRQDAALRFESGWLQNHRFAGAVTDAGGMELLHGLSHGDEPVPVRYGRR